MHMIEHPEHTPGRKGKAFWTNLSPCFDRKFRDLDGGGVDDGHLSTDEVRVVHHVVDCAFEAFVVWKLWEKKKKHPHHQKLYTMNI